MMETTLFLLTVVSVATVLCVKVDKLDKKPKDQQGRDKVKGLIDEILKGKDKVKDKDGNGLKLKKEDQDNNGNKISRMLQEYDDLEVFGYEVIVVENFGKKVAEIDKATGKPTGKEFKLKKEKKEHGKFVLDIEKELGKIDKSQLNPAAALQDLKEKKAKGNVINEQAKPIIYIHEASGKAKVAYKVSFSDEDSSDPSIPTAIYDTDGSVIELWDELQHQEVVQSGTGPGGNAKIGKYNFGTEKPKMHVKDLQNGNCVFETSNVKVINCQQSTSCSSSAFQYTCYNQASDEINGGYSALNDANYFGKKVFDMFQEWYSATPLSTLPMTLKVHYGSQYENAFFSPSTSTFGFGDGYSTFHPLVCLDVMAHEMAHGYTNQKSNLVYSGESGGLNEAFSDMAGKAAERYARGYNSATFKWGIGYDIFKSSSGQLRCMDNPPCDGRSIDNIANYYSGMDVHYSSGLFNKVFYLLSQKFSYNLWDAFDLFFVANTYYWQSNTNFREGAELTLKAMDAMKAGNHLSWGYSWINLADIVDAFAQVGITCTGSGSTWDCV